MSKSGTNSRGIYDDAMFLIGPDLFLSFNANTDPSVYRKGIPSLIPGLHYYKKGMHSSVHEEPYPAFRPDTSDESLPVTRDGEIGISKEFAVNIHQGGYTSTSSEGCQTIYPNEWLEFQQTAYKAMDDARQKWIGYLLVEK
jgi:lysozyme